MSFETHLDETLLREIYAYWQGKRGLRRMPARRDVDPVEMPLLLPHLLIGEVVDGGAQFRYRLTGTAITRALGYDPTGRTIDDIASGHYRDHINELHRMLCRARAPLFAQSEAAFGHRGRKLFRQAFVAAFVGRRHGGKANPRDGTLSRHRWPASQDRARRCRGHGTGRLLSPRCRYGLPFASLRPIYGGRRALETG
jgi:hypothetical protein